MKGYYVHRRILKREQYYQFGEYFLFIKENTLSLYNLIINGAKRIILLGDAGYGKSTDLKIIASRFIEEENPNFIPIFIELDTYVDENLEDYVRIKIGKDSETLLAYDKSKLVFLFDEFDQVLNKEVAVRKIKNFKYSLSGFKTFHASVKTGAQLSHGLVKFRC